MLSDQEPLRLFISYSHKDEKLYDELEKHLALLRRQGLIQEWIDRRISAGQNWGGTIAAHLEAADIILLLISADFLASDYTYDVELRRAMERHEAGEARVIPIMLRPALWKPLIGRESETAAIRKLLTGNTRLLTLTGPPGVGKTHLALAVATDLLRDFADGIRVVSLAPIRDPDLVLPAIATSLEVAQTKGRSLQESLEDFLRGKQFLL